MEDTVDTLPRCFHTVVVLHDERTLCIAGRDHKMIFVVSIDGPMSRLYGHTAGVTVLRPHEEFLASGSVDSTVKIWDVAAESCLRSFHMHTAEVTTLSWLSSETLISGDARGGLVRWQTREDAPTVLEGHLPKTRQDDEVPITHVHPLGEGIVASVDGKGKVVIWREPQNVSFECKGPVTSITHLTGIAGYDDGIMIVVAIDQYLYLYDIEGGLKHTQPVQFSMDRDTSWVISEVQAVGPSQMLIAVDQFACDTEEDDPMLLCVSYDIKQHFVQDYGLSGMGVVPASTLGKVTALALARNEAYAVMACEKKCVYQLVSTASGFEQVGDMEGPFDGQVTAVATLQDGFACVTNHGEVFLRVGEAKHDMTIPTRIVQRETV